MSEISLGIPKGMFAIAVVASNVWNITQWSARNQEKVNAKQYGTGSTPL
jgi:hypothetical protein